MRGPPPESLTIGRQAEPRSLVKLDGSPFERAAEALTAAKRSPETRRAYLHEMKTWLEYCGRNDVDPAAAQLEASVAFRDALLLERSPASVHRALAALSSLYRALFQARVARANPFHPSVLAWPSNAPERPTPAVTDGDVRAMMAACDADQDHWRGLRDRALLELLWGTGLRRSSAARARVEDLQQDGDQLVLRVRVKGGKMGDIDLPEDVAQAIATWRKHAGIESGFLFPRAVGEHEPMSGDGVYRMVAHRAREAGCKGEVGPHGFRAALATAAFDAGVPEYEVQAALHHASPAMTRRYDRGRRGARALAAVATLRRARTFT